MVILGLAIMLFSINAKIYRREVPLTIRMHQIHYPDAIDQPTFRTTILALHHLDDS